MNTNPGYEIVRKEELAPEIKLFEIKAPWVAKKGGPRPVYYTAGE